MEFEVKEIKMIGSSPIARSLSLRLEAIQDANSIQAGGLSDRSGYTIHAVVPYEKFKTLRIGAKFAFVEVEMNKRVYRMEGKEIVSSVEPR